MITKVFHHICSYAQNGECTMLKEEYECTKHSEKNILDCPLVAHNMHVCRIRRLLDSWRRNHIHWRLHRSNMVRSKRALLCRFRRVVVHL
jgi:hypothetical protein